MRKLNLRLGKKFIALFLMLFILTGSLISAGAANVSVKDTSAAARRYGPDYHCCSYYCNMPDPDGTSSKVNRMFFDSYSYQYTAGVPRTTVIKAYIKAGETAYFGSNVHESYLSDDHFAYDRDTNERIVYQNMGNNSDSVTKPFEEEIIAKGAPTGCDIVVENPQSEIRSFDVKNVDGDKTGYIGSRLQETNGADYLGTGDSARYQPLSFTASYTGIYTFTFHSKYGSGTSPTTRKIDKALADNDDLAFWDITIVDNNAIDVDGSTYPERKPGRVFAKYIALNGGANSTAANPTSIYSNVHLYVLTSDGIKYKVNMDKIDPYGFVFFANNRGLYTNDINMKSIYHSVYTDENTLTTLGKVGSGCGVNFHSPMAIDTELNKTYNIFFEEPSDDLEHFLYELPGKPSVDEEIKFSGFGDENSEAYYKQGGYFKFTVANASTLTLTVDVSHVIDKYLNYTDEEIQADETGKKAKLKAAAQRYINEEHGNCKISISGPVTDGENSFFWDGRDTNDQYVPIGDYSDELIIYELVPKVGEVHFPLFDVEGFGKVIDGTMTGGLSIERINSIVDEDGNPLENVTDNDLIYYNNNPLGYNAIHKSAAPRDEDGNIDVTKRTISPRNWYVLSDGTKNSKAKLNDLHKNFFVVDSSKNPVVDEDGNWEEIFYLSSLGTEESPAQTRMAFNYNGGDFSAIDTWTYCALTENVRKETTTKLKIIEDDYFHGSLKGRFFYDTEPDGKYCANLESVDFPLGRYTVVATLKALKIEESDYSKYPNLDPSALPKPNTKYYAVTNGDGVFTISNLVKGIYTVDLYKLDEGEEPVAGYTPLSDYQLNSFKCTTKNINKSTLPYSTHDNLNKIKEGIKEYEVSEKTCTEANSYITTADDIGVRVDDAEFSYTMHKTWGESVSKPLDIIYVALYAAEKGEDGHIRNVGLVKEVPLSASNGWQYTLNNLSAKYLYYVVESYEVKNPDGTKRRIIIGGSDPTAEGLERMNEEQFEGMEGTIETEPDPESEFKASFYYRLTGIGQNGRYIDITNATDSYKVYFHMNLKKDEDEYFRVYYPRNHVYNFESVDQEPEDHTEDVTTQDGIYWLTEEDKILAYYSIPDKEQNENLRYPQTEGKVFLGWYYDENYGATTRPLKWNTDVYKKTTHIYAHWEDVKEVEKDKDDEKILPGSLSKAIPTYIGFDLFGTQLRDHRYDPNYDNGDPHYNEYIKERVGLRFATSIRNGLLEVVNNLYPKGSYYKFSEQRYEDGYCSVSSKEEISKDKNGNPLYDEYGNAIRNVENAVVNESKAQHLNYGFVMEVKYIADIYADFYNYDTIEYRAKNNNGKDTQYEHYYSNDIECTAKDYNPQTNIIDHRNFNDYRIMSMVVTYMKEDKSGLDEEKMATDVIARPYLRYLDANGLVRTFYKDYTGNSLIYGGCCTNYNTVSDIMDQIQADINQDVVQPTTGENQQEK